MAKKRRDTALTRSEIMARVKSKNTQPELRVRSQLHRAGVRFRLHRKDLPGNPDIVVPSRKCVIFVHGCFWHRHPGCASCRTPKSRLEFWQKKFDDNVARDIEVRTSLEDAGWRVIVVWECETKKTQDLERIAQMVLNLPLNQS